MIKIEDENVDSFSAELFTINESGEEVPFQKVKVKTEWDEKELIEWLNRTPKLKEEVVIGSEQKEVE